MAELKKKWDGGILIVFDWDETGRRAALDLAFQPGAWPIDLREPKGYDLADFLMDHRVQPYEDLVALPDLVAARRRKLLTGLGPHQVKTLFHELLERQKTQDRIFAIWQTGRGRGRRTRQTDHRGAPNRAPEQCAMRDRAVLAADARRTHEGRGPCPGRPEKVSRRSALAMMITPVLRPAIKGHVPLAAADAPQHGTGKSLLVGLSSIIATGRQVEMMGPPTADEELRKKLTSLLLAGRTFLIIDNVEGIFKSAQLASFITCDLWRDRVLGVMEMPSVPQRACVYLTANNVVLGGNLPRRTYWSRIDAQVAKPWTRTDFLHPELLEWAMERRGDLLAAVLTLGRNWFARGKPEPTGLAVVGGFRPWSLTLGSILQEAGVEGFLANADEFWETSDPELEEWEELFAAWHAKFGSRWLLVRDIIPSLVRNVDSVGLLVNVEHDAALYQAKPQELDLRVNASRRLGGALTRWTRRTFTNGLRLEGVRDSHEKQKKWRVVKAEERG